LWHQLLEFKDKRNRFLGRSLRSPDVPRGLYFWGGVGRGKSFLMDAFYACVPYRRKRRIHFHNFMAEVHRELRLLAGSRTPCWPMPTRLPAKPGCCVLTNFMSATLPMP
jgi:cell division protein ZapE